MGPGRPEGLQGTLAGRYLRDGVVVHGFAGTADSPAIAMFRMVLAEARSLIRQRDQIEAQAEALLPAMPTTHGFASCPASDRSSR